MSKQKFTFVVATPEEAPTESRFLVQIEDRNLGSATRSAIAKVTRQMANPIESGEYRILFACDGWPKTYSPQEVEEAAK